MSGWRYRNLSGFDRLEAFCLIIIYTPKSQFLTSTGTLLYFIRLTLQKTAYSLDTCWVALRVGVCIIAKPDIRRSVVVELSRLFRSTTKAVKSPPIISKVNIYTGASKIRTYLQKYPDICFLYHLEQSARVPLLSAKRWYQGTHYCLIQADCKMSIHCRSREDRHARY